MTRFIVFSLSLFCFCTSAVAETLLDTLVTKAQSGDAAARQLAEAYIISPFHKNPEEVNKEITRAAENGFPEAQFWLGQKYYHGAGAGVGADNYNALQWYEKAANQGHVGAQIMAAYLHQIGPARGGNLPQNLEKSIYWYQLAAEKEDNSALFYLGCFKYFGFGLAKNQEEGETLILKAAEKRLIKAKKFITDKEKPDIENLQKLCGIYPDTSAPTATKTGQRPKIFEEKHGNITNFKAEGNLASKQDIGCIRIEKAKNTFTPADLYKGISTCIAQKKFEEASDLFLLAGLYSRYDAARVTDKTAGQAGSVLITNTFSNIPPEVKATFESVVEKHSKDPAKVQRICEQTAAIGPPDYYPEYMILHGMKAFTGNPHEGAIASNFDKTATWAKLRTKHLHCKEEK